MDNESAWTSASKNRGNTKKTLSAKIVATAQEGEKKVRRDALLLLMETYQFSPIAQATSPPTPFLTSTLERVLCSSKGNF